MFNPLKFYVMKKLFYLLLFLHLLRVVNLTLLMT